MRRHRCRWPVLGMALVLGSSACSRGSSAGGDESPSPGPASAPAPEPEPPVEPLPTTPPHVEPSTLKSDETVQFLPTYATLHDGVWRIPVDAWVYEPEEDGIARSAVVEAVAEVLELLPGSPESAIVAKNLRPFVVDNESGKWVTLWRGAHSVRVGPTASNGRATAALTVPADDPAAAGEGTPPWVELKVLMRSGDGRRFSSWAQLVPDEGVSVISDIDDTIKISEVLDKRKLLENTFLRPYQAVPGMAQAYTRWAGQGVVFHYLSASPLPLLGALSRFAGDAGFPRGSLSLRPFRWTDGTAFELVTPSESYKREVIGQLMKTLSARRFVLIGDTGELDPEIYADVARQYPERVVAVYLRDPTPGGTPGLSARLEPVFEGVPKERWQVIADGTQLPESL